jgi:hypothetical protein
MNPFAVHHLVGIIQETTFWQSENFWSKRNLSALREAKSKALCCLNSAGPRKTPLIDSAGMASQNLQDSILAAALKMVI